MALVLMLAAAALLSWWLSGRLRRYAISRELLDRPNARTSHATPTPRGGGLSFVILVLSALPPLMLSGLVQPQLGWALLGGGGMVALVGWLDDQGHLSPHWRLLAHLGAALWGLSWIGGVAGLGPAPLVQVVAFWYLAWMVNLFNFMDGIDAIASLEAISVAGVGAALLITSGLAGVLPAVLPLLLAAAVAGFLVWNWPPAQLFMGDAGSGFLGFTLGLLTLQLTHLSPRLGWSWLILAGVFLVDATWTLLRRLWRRQRPWEAHRSHAYQRASRIWGGHRPVSLTVLAINLLWLAPLAALVAVGQLEIWIGLGLALLPLWGLAIAQGAGSAEGD
ncbi:hypothetical protein KQ313_00600 [Synechococcus sp. CS-1325]|uniref:hypothetical protein n=1 Tax=unclassified Synechococcus TaxID=2626047 RepID=UPI0021A6CF0B|nr:MULTISPECIES: hypothetical protein [unclassified Synechococcus]MCT0198192.1 hypothetical protein [Synechococcus sp. CS-1325]MCT0232987.1 hypothetical protein [Synechococcus sp. CS-1327]